jgi:hypothetical protein
MELTLNFRVCTCPLCRAKVVALELPDAQGELSFFKTCDDWYDWEPDTELRVIDQLEPLDHQGPPPGRINFIFCNGDGEDLRIETEIMTIKIDLAVSP